CDEVTLELEPKPEGTQICSFSTAMKMRAALTYAFGRNLRIGKSQWTYGIDGVWRGNPCVSDHVRRYMGGLSRRKAAAGECPISSAALNLQMLVQMWNSKNDYLRRAYTAPNYNFHRANYEDDWGGVLKRIAGWTIVLLAFRLLCRGIDILKLRVENLYFNPQRDDHVHIRPFTRKSDQHGKVDGFDVYVEIDGKKMPLCIARALSDWLTVSGIREGYLFPKIYGFNTLGGSESRMDQDDFLILFRHMLVDIGQDPKLFGVHALRRGGCQWMFRDCRMSLPVVLDWGSWSPNLTHAIILRYLVSDTDILQRPRSAYFDPWAQSSGDECRSCHRSCYCS
ncbi:DNA breaking-rejoining enzyme, partial [Rhodocollybia butyracea]